MAEDRMLSDEVLLALIKKNSGGGGGGTSNYNDLSNQPQINGNTLVGNKSASDLGLVAAETGKGLSTNDYTDADKAIVGGVTAALAGKQNALTAGSHIAIDDDTISVNRWAVPAGKVIYTVITSDENYGQNVHVQRHTLGGALIDDRTFLCVSYTTVNVDDLISIFNPYSSFNITLLADSDEHQSGYGYTVNPITTPTSNSFTFTLPQEEDDNDLIIRSELDAEVNAIKDGTNIDSFADVETALALKQDKTDNALQTTDKTVVGAVNELKSGLTNYQTQNDLNLEVPDRKNIAASVFNVETTTQYAVALYVDCKLEPSTTYTLSFIGTEGNKLYTNENVFSQESTITIRSGRTSVTVTTKSTIPSSEYTDGKGWKFLKNSIAQPNDNTFVDLQLEHGSTATAYTPYIPSVESRIEAVESGLEKATMIKTSETVTLNANGVSRLSLTLAQGRIVYAIKVGGGNDAYLVLPYCTTVDGGVWAVKVVDPTDMSPIASAEVTIAYGYIP